jgi:hypothetical protein
MERVDGEGERDQVPGVRFLVDGLKEKISSFCQTFTFFKFVIEEIPLFLLYCF